MLKRLKNMIIPILCLLVLLIFAGEPLREANAKSISQAVDAVNIDNNLNEGISEQEVQVLNTLTNNINFAGAPGGESKEEGKSEYKNFLVQYLGMNHVTMDTNTWKLLDLKINEINYLLKMEGKENISGLSTDSKEIAIGLTKDIFLAWGLVAGFNPSGDLISLSDESGSLSLANAKTYKQDINSGILLLVISVVAFLQVVCYILSRKSRIMIKDVKYNGFHKEEFAR